MEGDHARAIEYYEKWADADPGDAVVLYNLACLYAEAGRKAEGVKAIAQAALAGWSDAGHALADSDLALLRTEQEFLNALHVMKENARRRAEGPRSRVVIQERFGKYLTVLPQDYDSERRYPLAVLLHGHGQSAERFAEIAPVVAGSEFICVIPEAAYPAADTAGKGFSHLREREDFQEDPDSIPLAAKWAMRAAENAARYYPAKSRIAVAGFSQGAALALITAALYSDRITACCAHGGYLIKDTISAEQLVSMKSAGVKLLFTHGREDDAVELDEGVKGRDLFANAGLDVTFDVMEVGHVFTKEVALRVHDWLWSAMK